MQKVAVFTIASLNYLSFARTLLSSVAEQHPDYARYLILVDEPATPMDWSGEGFSVLMAKDIGIDGFYDMAFRYNIMELNTAVKPFFMSRLFEMGFEKAIYFDPDIFVFNKLDVIIDGLDHSSILLTPHITKPLALDDQAIPDEQEYLRCGTYNLGFIAVSNTESGRAFSKWWSEKCFDSCLNDIVTGLFVDQKWVNLAPALFDVMVLKHPGCNAAYWNLHERSIRDKTVNGEKLVFFHFSGILFDDLDAISKYQNRFTLAQRPELRQLFEEYKDNVIANGYLETKGARYCYNFYSDGNRIAPYARILYHLTKEKVPMPFDASSGFAKAMRKFGITEAGSRQGGGEEGNAENSKQRSILLFDGLLYLLFKMVGWRRYMLLLRYFIRVAPSTRQGFILEKLHGGATFNFKKADA